MCLGGVEKNRIQLLGAGHKNLDKIKLNKERVMISRVISVLALASLTAACATESPSPVTGRQLAQSMCSQCHVVTQRNSETELRARQVGSPPDFATVANEPITNSDRLRQFLKLPHGAMNNVLMREEDIDKIVEFILAQKRS